VVPTLSRRPDERGRQRTLRKTIGGLEPRGCPASENAVGRRSTTDLQGVGREG